MPPHAPANHGAAQYGVCQRRFTFEAAVETLIEIVSENPFPCCTQVEHDDFAGFVSDDCCTLLDAMFDLRASGRILDKYPARVDLLAYLGRALPNEKWTVSFCAKVVRLLRPATQRFDAELFGPMRWCGALARNSFPAATEPSSSPAGATLPAQPP